MKESKRESLKRALDDVVALRNEIRNEVLQIENDIKGFKSNSYLERCHSKKVYQDMGIRMCEQIIRKRMEETDEKNV